MFTISGIVTDSVLGSVLPGVRVAAGPIVTEADAGGLWSLIVPAGTVTVTTSPEGYERASESIEVRGPVYVNLMARRLAPVVQECARDGDQVHALVSDLQGRKTIERWERSVAIIDDPAGDYRVGAISWGYLALDMITWQVTLGPIAPDVDLIRWEVYDSEGHRFVGSCEPAIIVGQQ